MTKWKKRLVSLTALALCFANISQAEEAAQANNTPAVPVFTLTDVIALAIRNNPSLQQDELSRVTQKLSLALAENYFQPQYTLGATYNYNNTVVDHQGGVSRSASLTPNVSLNNHYGTAFSLSADNPISYANGGSNNPFASNNYNPAITFTITQQLLQGFGKTVVDASLNNAKDSEEVNKLTLQQNTATILQSVITSYFTLIQSEQSLEVARDSLKNYEDTLKDNEIQIQLGNEAPAELLQTKASIASQKVDVESAINQVEDQKQALLISIGLKPTTPFSLPKDLTKEIEHDEYILNGNASFPDLEKTQEYALANNVDYATAVITIRETARNVVVAKNDALPSLEVTAMRSQGGTGSNPNPGFSAITTNKNYSNTVAVSLSAPIDDLSNQAGITNAQVALQNAITALGQQKLALLSAIQVDLQNLKSNKEQLTLQKQAVVLKKQDVAASIKMYKFGRLSTFELVTKQEELTSVENNLISNEIDYATSILQLDTDLNTLLTHWNINIRY